MLSDGDGNPRILSDNQGNVGVGTIPSTGWNTSGRVLEWGNSTYHAATFQNGDDDLWFTSNAYFDGTNWKAYRTNTGSWLHLGFKGFYVQGADSVSAGANFTPVKILNVEKGQTLALEGGTQTSGVGIAFPGTQVASTNANTLDDYEQGSWTPVLYFAGVNSNSTYDDVYGSYTKIGNQVFCRFGIRLDVLGAGGSSSDGAQISGLPFTNYGASYADAVGQLGGNCFTSTESGMANIANGGTWFSIRSGSGVSDDIVKSDFGNGKFVFGSFFYNVE